MAAAATPDLAKSDIGLSVRELDERVAAEQVRMVYNQLPISISGTLISST